MKEVDHAELREYCHGMFAYIARVRLYCVAGGGVAVRQNDTLRTGSQDPASAVWIDWVSVVWVVVSAVWLSCRRLAQTSSPSWTRWSPWRCNRAT